jgi:hypothetical protein
MSIELRCVGIHDLLGMSDRVLMLVRRLLLVRLPFWQLVGWWEEIHDVTESGSLLIYGEGCRKLPVCAYLDGVQQSSCEILAVIADQIVRWSFVSHVVDDHLA